LTPRVWSPENHLDRPDHNSDSNTIGKHLQVFVRDDNVEQALRVLKRKMQREGIFREMKRRKAYEKPSERRTREKAEAIRRVRKAARKQAQRNGLMPKRRRCTPFCRAAQVVLRFLLRLTGRLQLFGSCDKKERRS
jgi:small subunit ribosomal protein S21